jgi:hypothetical protein
MADYNYTLGGDVDQQPNPADLLKKGGGRKNPKVSVNVTYGAFGHDRAAYERLLEVLRELARSKQSFQEQKNKS